jgi:ZIP family zinc transporter
MIAACVWSLIIPSIELSEKRNVNPALPAALGFALGILFFLTCDALLARRRRKIAEDGGKPISRVFMSCFAIALHNLPEGMAVGAVFAEALAVGSTEHFTAALVLSIGIAVQNLPEGAIISLPLYADGTKKIRAFTIGALSGIVEPVGAFITILAAGIAVPLLPYLLGFAAGAMIYAVLNSEAEIDTQKANYVISFSAGFLLMMCLDVLLG